MNVDRRNRPGRGPAPAATAQPLAPGDLVYLVPRTPGAPTAAYRQPRVRVVELIPLAAEVRVELPDGAQITVSSANIARRPIEHRPPAPRPARRVRVLDLAPNEEEVPLWS